MKGQLTLGISPAVILTASFYPYSRHQAARSCIPSLHVSSSPGPMGGDRGWRRRNRLNVMCTVQRRIVSTAHSFGLLFLSYVVCSGVVEEIRDFFELLQGPFHEQPATVEFVSAGMKFLCATTQYLSSRSVHEIPVPHDTVPQLSVSA